MTLKPDICDAVRKFHDTLTSAGMEYSALSWNGFNLFGDRASIDEARRMMHDSEILPAIRDELARARKKPPKP